MFAKAEISRKELYSVTKFSIVMKLSILMISWQHNFVITWETTYTKVHDPASANPRPMANGIWQSLGLDRVNTNVYAKVYQYIMHSSRVRANFILFLI